MNTLTVNLHLLMVSFYRPAADRTRIVIEDSAFPSDSYAVRSQARHHGFDPDEAVVRLRPRPGEETLRTEDVVDYLDREGHRVALVLFGGVNYLTGELLDIPAITRAGHAGRRGGRLGPRPRRRQRAAALHDWDVDFAAWCTYKYLNSGPGALAGVFIHERHLGDPAVAVSRAGGAPTRRPGSRWPRCRDRRPPRRRGRSPTRRCWPWRRCVPRWPSSTRWGCPRCEPGACG